MAANFGPAAPVLFPLFVHFPPEIRREVWWLCLPRRVVEIDVAPDMDGYFFWEPRERRIGIRPPGSQICDQWSCAEANGAMPLIAQVCREAHEVAVENGQVYAGEPSPRCIGNLWVQPGMDVLNLTYLREVYANDAEVVCHLDHFLRDAANLCMTPCVSAHSFGTGSETLLFVRHAKPGGVVLIDTQTISIHIDGRRARQSGLFGMFGDERVQLVDLDDVARIRDFHRLWESAGATDDDPEARRALEYIMNDNDTFQKEIGTEMNKLYLTFLSELYHDEVQSSQTADLDLYNAWIPPVPPGQDPPDRIDLDPRYMPNETHPWVVKKRAGFPVLVPKIKFRHCLERCYNHSDHDSDLEWGCISDQSSDEGDGADS
ncbi:hypothetical protein ACO1O0_005134 [Amphichorda felina]